MRLAPCLLSLLLAAAAMADDAALEADEHTLLLCPFDEELDAASARGDAKPRNDAPLTAAGAGRFGKAMSVTADVAGRAPTWNASGNIDANRGTLEFAINVKAFPQETVKWTTAGLIGLSRIDKAVVVRHMRISIVQASNRRRLAVWEYRDGVELPHQINVWIDEWKTGEWHTIALTWDGRSRRLLIDGKLAREDAVPFTDGSLVPGATDLTVGNIYHSEAKPLLTALIDELRVSDTVRY